MGRILEQLVEGKEGNVSSDLKSEESLRRGTSAGTSNLFLFYCGG